MFIFIFGQFLDFWLQLVYKGLCTKILLFQVNSVLKSLLTTFIHPEMLLWSYEDGIKQLCSRNFQNFRLNGSHCGNFTVYGNSDNFFLENSVPFAAVNKFSKVLVKWKAPKVKRAFSPTWPASLQILSEQNKAFTQEKSSTLEHQHGCSFTKWLPQRQQKTVYCERCENGEFQVDYVGETCKTSPKTKCATNFDDTAMQSRHLTVNSLTVCRDMYGQKKQPGGGHGVRKFPPLFSSLFFSWVDTCENDRGVCLTGRQFSCFHSQTRGDKQERDNKRPRQLGFD